ncbi:plasmid partition protein ParG [Azotobacter vinelandii]|uniref:plasmid partition protein ParG n=1 Tax=Azotobacter vinelandii TaxID=354 RepID=UPI000AD7893F|nr:plasmid partition protein ParG [Azotobacter vinelandii]WKN23657.1 chromosome partitioning protein ParB [Azotobacter vinelandii]
MKDASAPPRATLPSKGETVRVNFDMDRALHARLKAYAARNGKTVKELLAEYVNSLADA